MNNRNERELLVETGRELLEKNIVARTWGNTSCRVDDEHCLITPSGLDYMQTTEEDIVLLDLKSGADYPEEGKTGSLLYDLYKNVSRSRSHNVYHG